MGQKGLEFIIPHRGLDQPYFLSPSDKVELSCILSVGQTIYGAQNVVFRFCIIIKPSRVAAPVFPHWVFPGTFVQKICVILSHVLVV